MNWAKLLPLLLLGASPLPHVGHPALWKVADADTTIYLFGTIHALPPGYRWRGGALDAAMAASQSLTLEVVLDEHPERLGEILLALGRAPGLPPLVQRVPAGKRAALAALIKASGYPPAALDGFKTWAAAVVLTGAAMKAIDVGAADGVEAALTRTFRAAGKPVEGLETAEQQLGFFDKLPEVSQRRFLEATLDSPKRARADFMSLVAAWSSGDPAKIARAFADDPEFTPALRELLIRQRDANWAEALAKRLDRPGTVFVAVGAGHLVGPDSVQHMLAAKGIKAVGVQ